MLLDLIFRNLISQCWQVSKSMPTRLEFDDGFEVSLNACVPLEPNKIATMYCTHVASEIGMIFVLIFVSLLTWFFHS